jgi:nucleotide-binding universal stress UspA family protein
MSTGKSWIVAYDGSLSSINALKLALRLMADVDSLTAVTVAAKLPHRSAERDKCLTELDERRSEVGAVLKEWHRDDVGKHEFIYGLSGAKDKLAQAVHDAGDDAVLVTGSRGLSKLKRLLTSSTSEHLARNVPAPVVIAKCGAGVELEPAQRDGALAIAVAIDECSPIVANVLAFASSLVNIDRGDTIHLLHVCDVSAAQQQRRQDAEKLVERAADRLRELGIPNEEHIIESADARQGIANFFDEHIDAFDLIVLGSRGLSTVKRTTLGSVSDFVIRHVNVSTIVVKQSQD